MTRDERFWQRVVKTPTCWWWTGGLDGKGYGFVRRNKIGYRTHRLAWIEANGPIPNGLYVCHRCDNRRCVRPDHLFLGTQQDNIIDMVGKQRHRTWTHPESYVGRPLPPALAGEQNPQAKLTAETIRAIRDAYAAGVMQKTLAAQYGIRQGSVSRIVLRQAWAHVA